MFRQVFLAILSLALFSSCQDRVESKVSAEIGQRQILLQRPSAALETRAPGNPNLQEGWGNLAVGGWSPEGEETSEGLGVRAKMATTNLNIRSTGPADRVLAVDAWNPTGAAEVEILLNGSLLGQLALSESRESYELAAPASAWKRGINKLVMRSLDGVSSGWVIGSIDLDVEQLFDETKHDLDPGVGAAWDVLTSEAGWVDLALSSKSGDGSVVVQLDFLVPGDVELERVEERSMNLTAGQVERMRLLFPEPQGKLLRVGITWAADQDAGKLHLGDLQIVGGDSKERPPVLFLSIDTLSAQNMSTHGYFRDTTPNLNALLRDCINFSNARSNASWTVPSYTSQFTGLYMSANRLPEKQRIAEGMPFGPHEFRVSERRWTMGELFAADGYRTCALIDNLWLMQISGLRQGFEVFDGTASDYGTDRSDMGMRYVLPKSLDFLTDTSDPRPPFVFAQIFDIHGPYHPVDPFKGAFAETLEGEAQNMVPLSPRSIDLFNEVPRYIAGVRYPDFPKQGSSDLLRADYDEKVLELDAELGSFFQDLKDAGIYDDLLIVFSADHGEGMDDHQFLFRHGISYDSAIHVPLFVKLPHQQNGGTRVDQPVQLVDLMPTFTEALGYPQVAQSHGQSLWPLMMGQDVEPKPILSQSTLMDHSAVVDQNWKLVRWLPTKAAIGTIMSEPHMQQRFDQIYPGVLTGLLGQPLPIEGDLIFEALQKLKEKHRPQYKALSNWVLSNEPFELLFDLSSDPMELVDVSAAHPDVVDRLREIMVTEIARADQMRTFDEGPSLSMSAETQAQLEALGYVTE